MQQGAEARTLTWDLKD